MFVIGTAGHVDHGKSALVRTLTGIDPDRLPEEKEREMTIDLGFAWLFLPNGIEVGIVDVPGHERFVRNMIAGVGGIDAVLFVVAADDGWMPQSEEHLHIVELLEVKQGIVVLTKTDLVKTEWLSLVEEDIKEKLKGTFLENAPLVKTSVVDGTGIEELRSRIDALIKGIQPKKDLGKPRLYIDRVFTILGRGTVVTGTLINGSLSLDQEIKILPQNLCSRIRDLQTHKKKREKVDPGTRVAMNLAGLEKKEIKRGDVITASGFGETTNVVDTRVKMIPSCPYPLKHNLEVLFILGTTELLGKAIILEKDMLKLGEEGLVQFRFKKHLVARLGDHFILRLPSPPTTIGGGVVLNLEVKRHKRNDPQAILYLQRKATFKLPELLTSELERGEYLSTKDILRESNFSQEQVESELKNLENQGKVILKEGMAIDSKRFEELSGEIVRKIKEEHEKYPFKPGLKISNLASTIKTNEKVLEFLIKSLIDQKKLIQKESYLSSADHKPELTADQQRIASDILKKFRSHPETPPTKDEIVTSGKDYQEVLSFLVQQKTMVELSSGILFLKKDFEEIQRKVKEFVRKNGPSTVSQIREHLGMSRKYAVPILEMLDHLDVTRREGDKRVLF
ncbi:MAG: hypothetical protein AMJ90_05200 [candidate division Zixibacteria bacterium SM23_73_2]|nr:MAG: hypothetical protein AMJ90_05200 [candidate division Zixibacteria bacterium SM23_73_2]